MSDTQGAAAPAPEVTSAPSEAPTSPDVTIRSGVQPAVPVTIVETPAKTPEDTMREVYLKHNPPRTEDGKYEAKNPSEAKSDQLTSEETKTAPAEPASPLAIDAPQSWTAEMKSHWSKLSPETQEYVAKREAEATKRISELGTHAKSAESLRHVFDKHRATLRGANESEAVDQLLAANAYLQQSPTEAIKWLANAYRVDLGQFSASRTSPENVTPESEQFTRALQARDQQIAELTRAVQETRNHVLAEQNRQAQTQQATLQKLIDDFKADKPHWASLEDDVVSEVIALRNKEPNLEQGKLLEKAYARALRVNEDVSKLVELETRKAKEAETAAEAKRKADEAKRLASINPKSSTSGGSKPGGSWEQTMREHGRRLISG